MVDSDRMASSVRRKNRGSAARAHGKDARPGPELVSPQPGPALGYDHGVKLVAIVSMAVDHVGMIFFPSDDVFRVIGRLAMPLFAYLVATGVERTQNRDAYLCRLLALFVCSQFIYGLFVGTKLNVFLPLLVGGLLAKLLIERNWGWASAVMAGYSGFALQHDISYGVTGPLLVLSFATLRNHLVVATAFGGLVLLLHGGISGSRFSEMAVFVMPLVPVVVRFVHWRSESSWRWAYWVYPGHLALLYVIAWHIGLTEFFRR